MISLNATPTNLQNSTQECSGTYIVDVFTFNFFGLRALGTGVAPEVLVGVWTPVEGGVCPTRLTKPVDNGSTVSEDNSCPVAASSLTNSVSTLCFESLGFEPAGLKKKR